MTAQGLITDAVAKRIAVGLKVNEHDKLWVPDYAPLTAFVATGEIRDPDGWPYHLKGAIGPLERQHAALLAYVAFHGERGPVESWSER